MSSNQERSPDYDAPGTGPFYVYDAPTIERAMEHGCLDEDVETGDPIACATCVFPPGSDGGVSWLEHDAEACGLNRSPFVDETHDLAHQVALTYLTDRATPEKDAGLTRDPADMADACLATWLTPSELQMRHERGDHEHCPPTWCQVAAIYQQADDQCRRARESSVFPPGSGEATS